MIDKTPIFVELDRPRRLAFNLNTEILIRSAGGEGKGVLDTVGESVDDDGKKTPILSVNPENLRFYLWAAIQQDALRHDEHISVEDVGALLSSRRVVMEATIKVLAGIHAYYGDAPGEK